MDYGLWYPKCQNISLISYTYIDCVGSVNDRKSTSVGAFFLGSILVAQFNKNKPYISISTIKVEYIAVARNYTHIF